ncbi:MAG: NotI family restriction endonuclease [Elusimicrobiota bacterium]
MSVDPTFIIGEVLGEPAIQMRNPVNADYECPYINSQCVKRAHGISGSVPVCSVWRTKGHKKDEPSRSELICVCPKRFFAIDLIQDIIKHCWKGAPPASPALVHEIKMGKKKDSIGNVDCVIADLDANNKVKEFISVEVQAVDITGSYFKAYEALLNSKTMGKKPAYGFNFANVYKRFVTQLIAKGFFHAQWGTKIVAVVQDVVFNDILQRGPFPETGDPKGSNIVFMVYKYVPDSANPGRHLLQFDKAVGTHHTNLQHAVLYKMAPSKQSFCERIESKL